MTENQATDTSPSFCEIAGCSGSAVTEVWSVDQDRHLQVCWKHNDGEDSTPEAS